MLGGKRFPRGFPSLPSRARPRGIPLPLPNSVFPSLPSVWPSKREGARGWGKAGAGAPAGVLLARRLTRRGGREFGAEFRSLRTEPIGLRE